MLILLFVLLIFAVYLFCRAGSGRLSRRDVVTLYWAAAILTLISQIHARWFDCHGIESCGLSLAKDVVWSTVWPIFWLGRWAGL